MMNILTLESPQELLRIKRENILREIAVYGERERDNLEQAMQARAARKELETQLFEFDNTIDTLERLKDKEIEQAEKYEGVTTKYGTVLAKNEHNMSYNEDLGLLRALQKSGYKYLTRNRRGDFRAHIYFPYKIGNFWVSLGYFNIGYNINLTQVEWTNNKPSKIADLLATYENGGENGK